MIHVAGLLLLLLPATGCWLSADRRDGAGDGGNEADTEVETSVPDSPIDQDGADPTEDLVVVDSAWDPIPDTGDESPDAITDPDLSVPCTDDDDCDDSDPCTVDSCGSDSDCAHSPLAGSDPVFIEGPVTVGSGLPWDIVRSGEDVFMSMFWASSFIHLYRLAATGVPSVTGDAAVGTPSDGMPGSDMALDADSGVLAMAWSRLDGRLLTLGYIDAWPSMIEIDYDWFGQDVAMISTPGGFFSAYDTGSGQPQSFIITDEAGGTVDGPAELEPRWTANPSYHNLMVWDGGHVTAVFEELVLRRYSPTGELIDSHSIDWYCGEIVSIEANGPDLFVVIACSSLVYSDLKLFHTRYSWGSAVEDPPQELFTATEWASDSRFTHGTLPGGAWLSWYAPFGRTVNLCYIPWDGRPPSCSSWDGWSQALLSQNEGSSVTLVFSVREGTVRPEALAYQACMPGVP